MHLAIAEKILALYQQNYMGLNVSDFHTKLKQVHGIRVDYSWLKIALRGAGLLGNGRRNRPPDPGPGV